MLNSQGKGLRVWNPEKRDSNDLSFTKGSPYSLPK